MAHTDSLVAITDEIIKRLNAGKDLLGLEGVLYGDQGSMFPRTPYICVEPSTKNRELAGAAGPRGQTENTFQITLMIYHAPVKSTTVGRRECDQFAETVEEYIHLGDGGNDGVSLGGLVIHGYVTTIETGQAAVASALYQATRMTWTGLTKTLL